MSSWRDLILQEFAPNVARLTLVADPDGLLLEEGMLEGIRQRGFELIPFDDHVAFRYAYESNFRSRWDQGEQTDLVVVLRCQANDLGVVPHDLLQAGRKLSFNLGDVFPNLSYPVVTALDRGDLDALYDAQERHVPGQLGDNATKEFVLRHVFDVAPELIKQPSDLLRALLRRHYRGQQIPAAIDGRFIQVLRQNNTFDDWPIEQLAADREAFLAFLQERWPIFLACAAAKGDPSVVWDGETVYNLAIEGPALLPFEHPDVRVYVDNLFLEGFLAPVAHEHGGKLAKAWVNVGIRTVPTVDNARRLARLVDGLGTSIPADDARHTDWFHFARRWAELAVLLHQGDSPPPPEAVGALQAKVDSRFAAWLAKRYAGLVNLPPDPPVMLHHVPRFLARRLEGNRGKVALVVLDGLSLGQWLILRESLQAARSDWVLREHAVFAWVPSITPVSRQAVFAGKPPLFFPNSIYTTDKDSNHWSQFWADQGLLPSEVMYERGLGDGRLDALSETLSHPKLRVAGLVVGKIDRIMHGMELGMAGMYNQVRLWSQKPYLGSLLELLLERGFRVYLTSDHGNVEAKGCGRPAEGAAAELRGERVRVYPDEILRSKIKARFAKAVEWEPIGLPSDYLPLIAGDREAFVPNEQYVVSHGGICLEELVVPMVEIERKAK
jgi:hypothetical protein